MEYPEFVGGSYESQAATADAEKTVNWYFERMESRGATARSALYPTPGVKQFNSFGGGPGRAHYFRDGREFAVVGSNFLEVFENGGVISRGTVAINANPATISGNGDGGDQLFITSGDNGYIFQLSTNVLTQVAFLTGKATMGDHLNGFFLALDAKTSTFHISNLLDGLTWDPTQFAQRSVAPDPWRAMRVLGRYVWLLGEETSEVWYDAGNTPFPFAFHPSGLVPWGIAASFSVAVSEGALTWIARTNRGKAFVLRTTGFTPEVISTYAVQAALGRLPVIEDGIGDSYNDLGHSFYLLHFPEADQTWAWDAQSQVWAERGTWDESQNRYGVWRPRFHALAFGEHRILDAKTGSLYRMSSEFSLDADNALIRRLRRGPTLQLENRRLNFSSFELDLEPGLGVVSGQGSDPQVMLRISNDGGKTWSAEQWRGAGKMGEYHTRVRWTRCGQARRRTFEVSVSDPIPWKITNAYIEIPNAPREVADQNRRTGAAVGGEAA